MGKKKGRELEFAARGASERASVKHALRAKKRDRDILYKGARIIK